MQMIQKSYKVLILILFLILKCEKTTTSLVYSSVNEGYFMAYVLLC